MYPATGLPTVKSHVEALLVLDMVELQSRNICKAIWVNAQMITGVDEITVGEFHVG